MSQKQMVVLLLALRHCDGSLDAVFGINKWGGLKKNKKKRSQMRILVKGIDAERTKDSEEDVREDGRFFLWSHRRTHGATLEITLLPTDRRVVNYLPDNPAPPQPPSRHHPLWPRIRSQQNGDCVTNTACLSQTATAVTARNASKAGAKSSHN